MSVSLADPAGSGALVGAVQWIQGTLLGSVALVVATLAVAGVGFLMLTGRVDIRRGITVILGTFLLLGSPVLATSLQSLAVGGAADGPSPPEALPPPQPMPPPLPPANYDPYAGASVPPAQ
jgi:type IV secretory pathway VirB2 component (pilin)